MLPRHRPGNINDWTSSTTSHSTPTTNSQIHHHPLSPTATGTVPTSLFPSYS